MKILIVEDNKKKLKDIKDALEEMVDINKTTIDISEYTKDAKAKCRETQYDLVLLDLIIPHLKTGEKNEKYALDLIQFLNSDINGVYVPKNIVGTTINFDSKKKLQSAFEDQLLTIIQYDPSSLDWKKPLRTAIKNSSKNTQSGVSSHHFDRFSKLIILGFLALCVCVIFLPITYSYTSRAILFFVSAFVCALVWGKNSSDSYDLSLGKVKIKTTATTAVLLIVIYTLDNTHKPDQSINFYAFEDSKGSVVQLANINFSVDICDGGVAPTVLMDTKELKQIAVVFPKGIESAELNLDSCGISKYRGTIRYSPNQTQSLILGKDLVKMETK
jgi:CheY-like chemotaxis protein